MKTYNKIELTKLQLQQTLMLSGSSSGEFSNGAPGYGAEKGSGSQMGRSNSASGLDLI